MGLGFKAMMLKPSHSLVTVDGKKIVLAKKAHKLVRHEGDIGGFF